MQEIRILITTYHQAFLLRGGGEYEIFSIADGLKQKGLIVDIYGPYSRSLDNYDVILHFSVHEGGLDLIRELKALGKPIVLWPNLWMHTLPDPALINLINEHVKLADIVVFKSTSEELHVRQHCVDLRDKARRIFTVADPLYKTPAPKRLFKELYGVDRYAIWFGIIDPNKNQLAAIRVLRQKGIPLVLVGSARDKSYYEECKKAAGENVIFIEGLSPKSEIVRSALQEALFYIEVSFEPAGLSAIEAGLSGCRLLLNDLAWSREHFGDHAVYADPYSDKDISRAVDEVLERPRNQQYLVAELDKFCFPTSLDSVLKVFEELLK